MWIFLFNLCFISAMTSEGISSEGITTIVEKPDNIVFPLDSVGKIFEIGDSKLSRGYFASLFEKDAFKFRVREKEYYLILWNISENEVLFVFPGEKYFSIANDSVVLADINQDGELDLEFHLNSIEKISNIENVSISFDSSNDTYIDSVETVYEKRANIFIKKFVREELIPEGDYFELFDVTVRLANEKLYSSRDLEAYITFENFGEGASEINIVYSIINEDKEEVYRGEDIMVVLTEDLVVKNFNFLNLPAGTYILKTEIFYGDNQTGESEQDFEIVDKPLTDLIGFPLFFGMAVLILTLSILSYKKFFKRGGKDD